MEGLIIGRNPHRDEEKKSVVKAESVEKVETVTEKGTANEPVEAESPAVEAEAEKPVVNKQQKTKDKKHKK